MSNVAVKEEKTGQSAPVLDAETTLKLLAEVRELKQQLKEAKKAVGTGEPKKEVDETKKRKRKEVVVSNEDSEEGDEGDIKVYKGDQGPYIDLSAKRRITVKEWRGSTLIDIREFYEKEGDYFPGKKGISLTQAQYQVLAKASSKIKTLAKTSDQDEKKAKADGEEDGEIKVHNGDQGPYIELSAKRRVTVRDWRGSTLIDIREFYEKEGDHFPGKKGISLTEAQYQVFMKAIPKIENLMKNT